MGRKCVTTERGRVGLVDGRLPLTPLPLRTGANGPLMASSRKYGSEDAGGKVVDQASRTSKEDFCSSTGTRGAR